MTDWRDIVQLAKEVLENLAASSGDDNSTNKDDNTEVSKDA